MPREGHDSRSIGQYSPTCRFQSTCPARGTTKATAITNFTSIDFNPRAPRGARPDDATAQGSDTGISIHVPREGHDPIILNMIWRFISISIHVPREGHDDYARDWANRMFLISIHVPREGHDRPLVGAGRLQGHFNPRAPRGARPEYRYSPNRVAGISIHVPREGHDAPRRANAAKTVLISIHVPREGHDALSYDCVWSAFDFNPRAPRGARLLIIITSSGYRINFNPRAPRGARLRKGLPFLFLFPISIHVPREGHDYDASKISPHNNKFQSTCPARGTTKSRLSRVSVR